MHASSLPLCEGGIITFVDYCVQCSLAFEDIFLGPGGVVGIS